VPDAGVDRHLEAARARIGRRVQPAELTGEIEAGSLVVDIRPVAQRAVDGDLPGAVVVDRNVLEWRLDPTSAHRLPVSDRADRRVVVVCNEGYASSLAAASLLDVGLTDVTDLDGGFQAWLGLRESGG
jgi:rhodanese-related sulfurtransferase